MKHIILILTVAFTALMGASSSVKAQHDIAWEGQVVTIMEKNVPPGQEASAKEQKELDGFFTGDSAFFADYTKETTIQAVSLKLNFFDKKNSKFEMKTVLNSPVNILYFNVGKWIGLDEGKYVPIFTFNGNNNNTFNNPLVMSIDIDGDGISENVATLMKGRGIVHTPSGEATSEEGGTVEEKDVPSSAEPKGAQVAKAVTLPNGAVIIGDDLVINPDGSVLRKVNEKWETMKSATPLPQAQAPKAPADTTTKTATKSMSVTVSGDQDLLAQAGSANSAEADSKLPPGCFELPNGLIVCKEKVNGIETRTTYTPDGEIVDMDGNSEMAVVDMGKGRKILTSNNKAEAGNMRNAHKFGMREAAGYDGDNNYGKHGGDETGSKFGNFVRRVAFGGCNYGCSSGNINSGCNVHYHGGNNGNHGYGHHEHQHSMNSEDSHEAWRRLRAQRGM